MKKSNWAAADLLFIPFWSFIFMMLGVFSESGLSYLLGQVFGVLFFTQIFILQHEFGHNSLFKTTRLNTLFGHIASLFTLIPFYNWRLIHDLHHKWTGFRDKDPTTEKTFKDNLSPQTTKIVDFCWKWNIPVFTLGYRFGIYWSTDKLRRFLSPDQFRKAQQAKILYIVYLVLLLIAAPIVVLKVLPALVISFVVTDIISLSQHSHIEMRHSGGEDVAPLPFKDQARYTRGLKAPRLFSKYILFNFNRHIEHHMYPGLPCYHLQNIEAKEGFDYDMTAWVAKAKQIKGSEFIFDTGIHRI